MPLYHFDVYDRAGYHRDAFGEDFDTLEEALAHLQVLLPDVARDNPPDDQQSVACELRDEESRVLYRAELIYRGTRFPI